MRHILRVALVAALFIFAPSLHAQTPKTPQSGEPQPAAQKAAASDSAEFAKQFKELFALIKPTPSVTERFDRHFLQMQRTFKARGVDSAEAYKKASGAIDPKMDEEILRRELRVNFTADELKPMVAFFKTSAGKHFLEIESKIMAARGGEIEQYVNRTINAVVQPMYKPIPPPSPEERARMDSIRASRRMPPMPPRTAVPPTPPSVPKDAPSK